MNNLLSKIRTYRDFPTPGVDFLDLNPFYEEPNTLRALALYHAGFWESIGITAICAIEARGFILGTVLAQTMNVSLIPIRKSGKLPGETIRKEYQCEYASSCLELQKDVLSTADRILLVDDVLATGGTLRAATDLVESTGAQVVGVAVVIEILALKGRDGLPRTTAVLKV